MKLMVFLLFTGCAVKCGESSDYYVIERPSDDPVRDLKPFHVYWNVPSMQCKSKKVPFESLYERYGIVQNKDDAFQGEQITILYDPGLFPAILKDDNTGKLKFRNGGVPQEGNLDEHLTAFRYTLDHSIPDQEFNGIGIIDFESWRPVFRQNFGELTPYKNVSVLNERRLHPWWTRGRVEAEAKYRFERSGREFMQATLSLARLLRPRARWGYYGFPYCFNMASNNLVETCSDKVRAENDQISWLWSESTALYPSVYSSRNLSSSQLVSLIRGRIAEGARLGRGAPVLPYFWFRYRDAGFMSEVDLKLAIKTMYKSSASGFIIWGSSNDVNTVTKCEKLQNYLEQILGPAVAKYTKQADKINEKIISKNETTFNITTENPFDFSPSDDKIAVNKEESKKENEESIYTNTKDIVDRLLISDKGVNETDNNEEKEHNSSILIDILLSIVENVQKSGNKDLMEKEIVKINKDRKKGTLIHDSFTNLSNGDLDLSTDKYFNISRKKSDIFKSLFTTVVTPESNNVTETNAITSTTDNKYESTTEMWDYNNTFYNEHTFLDQDLNDTAVTDENVEIFVDDLYNIENNDEAVTTERDIYSTDFNKIIPDVAESVNTATEDVSTTEGTTVDTLIEHQTTTEALNDSFFVASETNQVLRSSQVDSKHFMCLFFYFYSVSKCLCDIYGQC